MKLAVWEAAILQSEAVMAEVGAVAGVRPEEAVVAIAAIVDAWEKGSPCCSLLCLVTLLLPFIDS